MTKTQLTNEIKAAMATGLTLSEAVKAVSNEFEMYTPMILAIELDLMMGELLKVKEENTADTSDWPTPSRKFTYRKNTIIKTSDLAL